MNVIGDVHNNDLACVVLVGATVGSLDEILHWCDTLDLSEPANSRSSSVILRLPARDLDRVMHALQTRAPRRLLRAFVASGWGRSVIMKGPAFDAQSALLDGSAASHMAVSSYPCELAAARSTCCAFSA